jgi:hypothetical protein
MKVCTGVKWSRSLAMVPLTARTMRSADPRVSAACITVLPNVSGFRLCTPHPSCRSTSQSGCKRTRSRQSAPAKGPCGCSPGDRGKHRARSVWRVRGLKRLPARSAGPFTRGRTKSDPRSIDQPDMASAACEPAGSSPCTPPITTTTGPGRPDVCTWQVVSQRVPPSKRCSCRLLPSSARAVLNTDASERLVADSRRVRRGR